MYIYNKVTNVLMSLRFLATLIKRGDRGHVANLPETVSCTNFKMSIATKLLRLTLNRLHYAKEGLLGYQSELKHDTTS